MKKPLTIMVDLDGVICTEEMTFERPLAQPLPGAKEALAQLKAAGHTVVVYTGRAWADPQHLLAAWFQVALRDRPRFRHRCRAANTR